MFYKGTVWLILKLKNRPTLFIKSYLCCEKLIMKYHTLELFSFSGLSEIVPDQERIMSRDRGQVLYINPSQVSDTALYKCVATSSAGEKFKDFDLRVYGLFPLDI